MTRQEQGIGPCAAADIQHPLAWCERAQVVLVETPAHPFVAGLDGVVLRRDGVVRVRRGSVAQAGACTRTRGRWDRFSRPDCVETLPTRAHSGSFLAAPGGYCPAARG